MASPSATDDLSQAIEAASNVAGRYVDAWKAVRDKNKQMLDEAAALKQRVPNDYYVNEYRAREKARVAVALLQALMDG